MLAVAADGSLWAASAHSGLAHRFTDGRADIYVQDDGLPSNELTDLALDAANGLWLATARDGLWRVDLATGVARKADGLSSELCVRVGALAVWMGAPAP